MSFETAAGSTLGVTTAAPATYNTAGYDALTYTIIGEITDLGGSGGRRYNQVEHAPVASRQRTSKKASFAFPPRTLQMAWDQADAGQDILRTAANADTILTFELVKQGGDRRWFTAQVLEFVENIGTVDTIVNGTVTLLPQTDITMDPA